VGIPHAAFASGGYKPRFDLARVVWRAWRLSLVASPTLLLSLEAI
jgi:hypothetical protein